MAVKTRLVHEQLPLFGILTEQRIYPETLPAPVITSVATPADIKIPSPLAHLSAKSPTIANLVDDYRKFLDGPHKSVNTVESFSDDIKRLGAFFEQERLVTQIGQQDLIDYLSSERHRISRSGKCLSPTTIFRRYTAIKNFFRWLYDTKKIIDSNPAELIPFSRVESPLPTILSSDEVDAFLLAASENPMEYVIALLLVGAGLKRGEVIALDLRDINIIDHLNPIVQIRAKHIFKTRTVTPPLEFVKAYRQYIEGAWTRIIDHIPGQWSGDPDDLNYAGAEERGTSVFSLTPRTISYLVKDVAEKAKIQKKVSCQILRDTFAVFQLMSGRNMDDVLKMLGLALTECNTELRLRYEKLVEIEIKKRTQKKCA